jgi:hypothetical protein
MDIGDNMENQNIQLLPDSLPDDIECKRKCIGILETVKDDNEYVPCIFVEDEPGYYPTNWKWGSFKEEADAMAEDYNKRLGIDIHATYEIIASTMNTS